LSIVSRLLRRNLLHFIRIHFQLHVIHTCFQHLLVLRVRPVNELLCA
jgi:hypothetical protein